MVLRGWLVQGLDIKWNSSVDPREAYAPFIHHKSTPDGFPCVAGSGKSIVWLVILLLSSCYSTHLYHKFCDRTTLYAISRRRTGYVSVFLLRFSGRSKAKRSQPCHLSSSPTFRIFEALLRYHIPALFDTRERHATAQQWYLNELFIGNADSHRRTPNFHHHGCTR